MGMQHGDGRFVMLNDVQLRARSPPTQLPSVLDARESLESEVSVKFRRGGNISLATPCSKTSEMGFSGLAWQKNVLLFRFCVRDVGRCPAQGLKPSNPAFIHGPVRLIKSFSFPQL